MLPNGIAMIPVIYGIAGPELSADERDFFRDCDPAGYILFARNCESPAQLHALTDDLRSLHGREQLLISIDQEGGRVTRMKPPQWPAYPPASAFDRLYHVAPASAIEAARANAHAIALDLAECGITVNCLPLLDIRQKDAHDVIGDRALGAEPMQVAALGRAVLDGLARGGVAGVIKHLPGHGRVTVDSHKTLPMVDAPAEELEKDLAPFRTLASATMAITAHILYPAWDKENPATQSPFIIDQIIRRDIGFDGLLITDDLDMEALQGTIAERAASALNAGCDIALNCWGRMDDMVAIAAALPLMSAETTKRLDAALSAIPPHAHEANIKAGIDRAELLSNRDRLLALSDTGATGEAAAADTTTGGVVGFEA